ncbi:hypothetical protein CVV65_15660 [Kyrpidia spormannii]|uniref:Efflux RND transporter periplasmic adaptor subunit n=1 Tax=Kyrpidia spormannii TaxID=2055160 RepID=A0A2K8NA23_9BACL|nr:efflux RND transporter periplasmic adaptor subunit [Kyrpidia spormannii]ATY86189.1 hypothetical protein CVV65_15660 [Kyrpidia spormannii]
MRPHRLALTLVAALVLGAPLAGCAGGKPAATRQAKPIPVETTVVRMGDVGGSLTLTGQVQATAVTKVAPKLSGKVAAVLVKAGDAVAAGQALARIDTSDLEHQIAQQQAALQVAEAQLNKARSDAQNGYTQANSALTQAKVALDDAKTNYERTKNLFDAGAASQQQLDAASVTLQTKQAAYDAALQQVQTAAPGGNPLNQDGIKVAQAQVNQAQTALATLQSQLAEATVTSPVAGVVASRDVEPGEFAGPQSSVVTIAQINPAKVTIQVPENRINDLKAGMSVKVQVPAAGMDASGTLSRIDPVEDNTTKSYGAEVEIPNGDGRLKPGMVAQVTIDGLTPARGLVIPASAMVETPDGPKVFTVENNTAHQHLIQVGAVDSQHVQVLKGLKEGDVLVISGQDLLGEGAAVTIVQPGSGGASGGNGSPGARTPGAAANGGVNNSGGAGSPVKGGHAPGGPGASSRGSSAGGATSAVMGASSSASWDGWASWDQSNRARGNLS